MSKFAPLKTALENQGWSIRSIELASDCWWALDIWALRSEWSPVGKTIYLIFLLDPLSTKDPNNLPETDVWAVGLAETIPNTRPVGEITAVPVQNNFQRQMPEIVELVGTMRMGE